jgi:Flp pilus assembly protein CpaB
MEGNTVRRSPRAVAAWIAAVAVALVTARVVATDLATLHRRAADLGPQRGVVVAARDLALGATIARDDVDVVRMYASTIPRGAVLDVDDAVGRVVVVPVLRDAAVLRGHLATAGRAATAALVPDGTRAVRVPTADGLRPRPGDVVDVLVALDPSVENVTDGAITVARAARVLATDEESSAVAGAEGGGGPGVTLLVTEREAHAVAFAAANGVLMLALAPPEAACCTDPQLDTSARP